MKKKTASTKKSIATRSARVLFGSIAALFAAQTTQAASLVWDGDISALWSLGTNWATNPLDANVPGTGETATFSGAGGADDVINLGGGVTISTILFNTSSAAAYTIGSGAAGSQTLTLNAVGAITMSFTVAANELVNANVLLGDGSASSYTFTNDSATNSLTFAGGVSGGTGGTAGTETLTVNGTGATNISGVIGNGGATSVALVKSGSGTLTLNGAAVNTYTGATTVNGGTLALDYTALGTPTDLINSGSALAFGGGAMTIKGASSGTTSQTFASTTVNASGGSLLVDPNNGTGTTVNLNSLGTLSSWAAGSSLVVGKAVTANTGTVTITTSTLPTNGLTDGTGIYGGRIVIASGTAGTGYDWATTTDAAHTLSAYSGYTAMVVGATSDTLNDSTGSLTLSGAHTHNSLKITSSATLALDTNLLTLNSGGLLSAGTVASTISGTANPGLVGGSNGGSNYDLIVQQFNSAGLTISAIIGDNSGNATALTTAGVNAAAGASTANALILSGANTFTGATYINSGTLKINALTSLQNTSGIKMAAGARLEANIANLSLAKLNPANGGSGVVAGSFLRYSQAQTTAGTSNGPGTIFGTVEVNLTTVNPNYTLDFGTGSTMTFLGGHTYSSAITLSGDATINAGANNVVIGNISASTLGTKTLILTGSNGGGSTTGLISDGSGQISVVKEGAGKWNLLSTSSFSGPLTINAGTIVPTAAGLTLGVLKFGPGALSTAAYTMNGRATTVAGLSTDPTTPGSPQVNAGGGGAGASVLTINNSASYTFAGDITDGTPNRIAVTKTGPGTQTLSGTTRNYTGLTTVSGGTLLWAGAVNVAGALTVNAGGNFSMADGTARNITTTTLTLATGSTLTFDWNGSAVDNLAPSVAINPAGGATIGIQINPTNSPTGGPLNLITGIAGSNLQNPNYFLANNTNFTATLTKPGAGAGSVTINTFASVAALTNAYWLGGQVPNAVGAMALSRSDGTAASNWVKDAAATQTSGGVVPGGSAVNVIFGATGAAQQANVTTGADMNLGSITFNDGAAVTIAGSNFITLNNTTTTPATSTAALATILTSTSGAVSGNNISAITVTANANATNTISAKVVLGANQTWNVASGKTLVVSGVVTGPSSSGLTVAGGGTVTLSGAPNTFTGSVTVDGMTAGTTLKLGNAGGFGNALVYTSGVTVNSGATLDLGGVTTTAPFGLTLNGSGNANAGALINSTGTGTYSGLLTLGSASRIVANNNINISGPGTITGATFGLTLDGTATGSSIASIIGTSSGTLIKTGSGTWTLSSPTNTYTGKTSIEAGILSINSIKNVGAPGSTLGVPANATDGTIDIGTSTTAGQLTYTGTGDTTDRVINLAGTTFGATLGQSGTGLLKFTSAFTATGSGVKTLTLQGSTAGFGEIAGAIVSGAGATSVAKAGSGLWTLSGASTYTGTTTLTAGTLNVGAAENAGVAGPLGAPATPAGSIIFSGGTLQYSAANQFDYVSRFTSTGNNAYNIDTNGQFVTFATALPASGSSGLTKLGTGTLILGNSGNAYTGATTVSAGTLQTGASDVIPNVPNVSVSGNAANVTATLDLNGNSDTIGTLGFGGATTSSGAAVTTGAGTLTLGGDVTYTATNNPLGATISGNLALGAATRTFAINDSSTAANDLTVSAAISGSGVGLTKTLAGTLLLTGTNTYNGVTTVTTGTLMLGKRSALYNDTAASWTPANISVAASATLGLSVGANASGYFDTSDLDTLLDVTHLGASTPTTGLKTSSILGLDTTNATAAAFTYNSVIANPGTAQTVGLTKLGAGTLTLGGANTYSGPTTVSAGVLKLNHALAAQNSTVTVSVANGLTFGTGLTPFTIGGLSGSTNLQLLDTGSTAIELKVGNNNAATTYGGALSGTGASLTKIGTGTLILTNGGSTYTGPTKITKGVISTSVPLANIGSAGFLGAGDATSNATNAASLVFDGGTLQFTGGATPSISNRLFTITGGTTTSAIDHSFANRVEFTSTGSIAISGTNTSQTFTLSAGGTNNGNNYFAPIIPDNGTGKTSIVKAGGGSWNLRSANTFSGDTLVSGGTLITTNSLALQNSAIDTSGAGVIAMSGGTLVPVVVVTTPTFGGLKGSKNLASVITTGYTGVTALTLKPVAGAGYHYSGNITNGAAGMTLTKTGAGHQTLAGTNTYTGATSVNVGTLNVTGSLTSAVTVASAAILSGQNGTTSSTLALNAGSIILGVPQVGGAGNAFRAAGAVTAPGGAASALVSGSDGSATVGVHNLDVVGYGTTPGVANFSTANYRAGAVVADTGAPDKKITLTYTNAARTWGSAASTWDILSTVAWQEGDFLFGQGDAVTFDDSGTGGGGVRTVTLNTLATPGGVSFNNATSTYIVSGTGGIGGATGLTKTGGGTATLSTNNSYTGVTTLGAGVLSVATIRDGGVAGNLGQATAAAGNLVFDGGTLQYTGATASTNRNFTINSTKTATFDVSDVATTLTISGAATATDGALIKTGAGTLLLSGANLYTGATAVNEGVLAARVASVANTSGAFGNNSAITMGTALSAGLNITGFNTQIGSLTGGDSGAGGVVLGAATLSVGGDGTSPAAYLGPISGTGGVTKIGSGTWMVSGNSSYTGVTKIDNGVLNLGFRIANGGIASSMGQSTNAATNLVIGGGTLKYSGTDAATTDRLFTIGSAAGDTAAIDASGTGALAFTNIGSIAFGNTNAHTLTLTGTNTGANSLAAIIGNNTGATSLVKDGAGKWTVSAGSGYTGSTTVNNGNLVVSGTLSGTTAVSITGGTLEIAAADRINNAATVTMSSGTFKTGGFSETIAAFTLSGTATIDLGAGASILQLANSSAQTWTGGLSITNWSGLEAGGGTDQIFFGTDATGLTAPQIALVSFVNPAGFGPGTYGATQLGTGELVVVPEPGAAVSLLGGLGLLLGVRRRRSA